MKQSECYYKSYSTCTCSQSPNCDSVCIGVENCEYYISEGDYFSRMMEGTLPIEEERKEDQKKRQERINKNLFLGKTKKQLKHDKKIEDEKNGVGTGYSLKDDPRFKNLFGN